MLTANPYVTPLRHSTIDDAAFALCLAAFAVALASGVVLSTFGAAESAPEITATVGNVPAPDTTTARQKNGPAA